MNIPWYMWIGVGFFLGLFIGNKKFRAEVDKVLAHMMGRKAKEIPPETPEPEKAQEKPQIKEIDGGVREVRRDKRGTHIRDIYFDD